VVTKVANRDDGDCVSRLVLSDVGAGCRVGTCSSGPLGMPVFLCHLDDSLSRGGAGVPLASHEGEHTGRKKCKVGEFIESCKK